MNEVNCDNCGSRTDRANLVHCKFCATECCDDCIANHEDDCEENDDD